jgi:hypothetical protein
MNVITQTQAFASCSDDDESVSVSAEGIIPLVSPPIVAKENVVASAISYYDIFQRPYKFWPQVKCCNTPLQATSVKAHKRKQRSAKKSPPSSVKVNQQMEECDRKAIAALKTQQLFEIKARFARTS